MLNRRYGTQEVIVMAGAFSPTRVLHVLMVLLAWGWSFGCFGSLAAASNGRLDVTLVVGGALTLPVALLPGLRLRRARALRLTMLLLLSALPRICVAAPRSTMAPRRGTSRAQKRLCSARLAVCEQRSCLQPGAWSVVG